MKDKKIVGIDPGKCDLIYCVDDCNKEANNFRYSQNQRRKESKSKKFAKIRLTLKKEEIIEGKTVIEWETELSPFNRKTLNVAKFKDYIRKKSEINGCYLHFMKSTFSGNCACKVIGTQKGANKKW